jgi:hypothetical protein
LILELHARHAVESTSNSRINKKVDGGSDEGRRSSVGHAAFFVTA